MIYYFNKMVSLLIFLLRCQMKMKVNLQIIKYNLQILQIKKKIKININYMKVLNTIYKMNNKQNKKKTNK